MKTLQAFFFMIAAGFAVHASAAELPMGWTSARALGMGNAFTAVADNSDAIFYNPAQLCRIKGIHWTVMDPHVSLNGLDKIQYLATLPNATSDIPGTVNKFYGNNLNVAGGAKTAFTFPCFGFAGFTNTQGGLIAHNPANTALSLNYFFDYGVAVAGGIPIVPGFWTIGLGARRINRTGTSNTLSAATLAQMNSQALQDEFNRRGNGYGVDIATTFSFPGPVRPAISVVYRDLGNTSFTWDQGAGAPPSTPSELIIGSSLEIDGPFISVIPAVDYRYVNQPGVALGKNINIGAELSLPLLSIRAGLHQGYYTAGLGVDLGIIEADLATYGVELGEYPGQMEDRRYMAQVTIQLGFDPFIFGLGGGRSGSGGSDGNGSSGGERRHLKRRR